MERKLRAFTEEESLAYIAFEQYMARWQNFMAKKEAKEKGIEEGIKEGIKKGMKEGVSKGKVEEARTNLFVILKKKYPEESLSFLNDYSLDEVHIMMDHIFEPISLEELKAIASHN